MELVVLLLFTSAALSAHSATHLQIGHHEVDPILDPVNEAVYREIYEETARGDLHVQLPSPREIAFQQQLQQMYTELFQTSTNRVRATLEDGCSGQITAINFTSPSSPHHFFFSMNHDHLASMHSIKQILLQQPTPLSTLCTARFLRDRTNRHAWVRALVSATASRPDMAYLRTPPLAEITPSLFINNNAIQQAKRSASDSCTLVDGSVGRVNGAENRLWYWREDLLINSNHWFWHLSNPFSHARLEVPVSARPDRRGELFYYFHRGILARYHAERIGVGLPPSVPLFLNRGTVLKEPYYAFLTDANSARNWTDRAANTRLEDLVSNRDFINHPANISIGERLEFLRRIEESIRRGALSDRSGRPITLDPQSGIDLLAEVVEASIYSVNPDYYSEFGIHNDGHFLIGLVADPDDTLRLPPSVMADGATAMRDPLFYTYHLPIDGLFDMHKRTLEPYRPSGGDWPLHWPSAEVTALALRSTYIGVHSSHDPPNILSTHWDHKQINLVRGLDFNRSDTNGSVYACVRHLDHAPFEYRIEVQLRSLRAQRATVRIFLAPRFDPSGVRYPMAEQRKFFFPMDHFTVDLKPGKNVLSRNSQDSSLTIPWPQTYEELERDSGARQTPYCGCGWPQHLLLPKGTAKGQVFDLFVMLTDAELDQVRGHARQGPTRAGCRPAFMYCGVAGQPYPDARPMNYPFDRLPYSVQGRGQQYSTGRPVQNLDEYTFGLSNMATAQVLIKHNDQLQKGLQQFPDFGPAGQNFGHGFGPGFGPGGPINFGGGGFAGSHGWSSASASAGSYAGAYGG